jgi:outer membrane protein OmpA-like peptidoglycan-associated protein
MRWPVALGVRVRPSFKMQFLAQLADCTGESADIADFPEYEHELNAAQKLQLRAIAERIVFSQKINPIAAVVVIGHADLAQRLTGRAATEKEMDVSRKRAEVGRRELIKMLQTFPDGIDIAAKIDANMQVDAKGATKLVVAWPRNEAEMRQNRRIEFRWARCPPIPIIHPAIEFPPRPPPSEKDDPNVVFAGQRFKSKIIEGASASVAVGGFITLTMVIWDIDNSRLAGYDYNAGSVGPGVNPNPFIDESNWSEFTTPVPIQVDQFSGHAKHEFIALALSSFTMISVSPKTSPPQWPLKGLPIGHWTRFAPAVTLQFSNGPLSLIRNSVRVFRGD